MSDLQMIYNLTKQLDEVTSKLDVHAPVQSDTSAVAVAAYAKCRARTLLNELQRMVDAEAKEKFERDERLASDRALQRRVRENGDEYQAGVPRGEL